MNCQLEIWLTEDEGVADRMDRLRITTGNSHF